MKNNANGLQKISLCLALIGLVFIGYQMLVAEYDTADLLPPPEASVSPPPEPDEPVDIVPASGQDEQSLPPPPPTTAEDVYRDAKYDFNAPTQMTVGQSVDITLYISLDENFDGAAQLAPLQGEVRSGTVEVTDLVEVSLDGGAFDKTPAKQPRLKLVPGRTASWTWTIKAKEPGQKRKLVLNVYAFEKIDGQISERIPIKALEEYILIDVSLTQQISGFLTSANGVLSSIASIIAIVGGWFAWARRRREKT